MPIPEMLSRKVLLITPTRVASKLLHAGRTLAEHVHQTTNDRVRRQLVNQNAARTEPREDEIAPSLMEEQRLCRLACLDQREIQQAEPIDVDDEIDRCEKVGNRVHAAQRSHARVLRQAIRVDTGDDQRPLLVGPCRQSCDGFDKRVQATVRLSVAEKQPERLVRGQVPEDA
jgi:hypothetical protein